ncbi:MAG: homoserine O-acetyltransferase [Gammaproteobacteria bacterium]|jgi:homoserine O-acetyltransferase/O-succinyltransferase|nr:homoserine O-acetyltransferase [Gammaproteobacteria bacterium]MBT4462056.1 homoserine O-acetyltransferase [Gammaproteobacteria bacterium]MBT4654673.1 homoserine O-acetyltransferase [Gammaproteobacteria bacterium]MBT5116743.1 homoserine O-acetyltransferase [Gammaproteobacteria bacterium]MBT5761240.1 homoserine O-acetyltransferase [Gammaproteobacteria bacterium]
MKNSSDNKVVDLFKHTNTSAKVLNISDSFEMKRGGHLSNVNVAYEAWGSLNSDKSNVIVIFTGLSASSHVTSSPSDQAPGWWETMVGDGKAIDTSKYYVICINTLGSCFGSTSPVSINEQTNQPYRLTFPELTVEDMANASQLLLDKIGIKRIHLLIGPSLGGMKAIAFSILHNSIVDNLILISTATQALPYAIALRSLQREVIRKDPLWNNGFYSYENPPLNGVRIARKIGMTSYRSANEWTQRFGRKKSVDNKLNQNTFGIENTSFEFEIESYLEHQAVKFQNIFDANCYLYLSRAMDWFDASNLGKSSLDAFSKININKALVLAVDTDTLFPPQQQKEIAENLSLSNTKVEYKELSCVQGHDSFLVDTVSFSKEIENFIKSL